MRISIIGSWNYSFSRGMLVGGDKRLEPKEASRTPANNFAYTLIELTVVVFLIGLMLALTMPRIQHAFLSDDLTTATRRMIGTIKTLRDKAIREKKNFKLYLDMESHRYWSEWGAMNEEERAEARENASKLPGNVRIVDVARRGKEKKSVGDAVIRFNKKGYVEHAVIHLGTKDDDIRALILSPFLGTVKVYDEYVDL